MFFKFYNFSENKFMNNCEIMYLIEKVSNNAFNWLSLDIFVLAALIFWKMRPLWKVGYGTDDVWTYESKIFCMF